MKKTGYWVIRTYRSGMIGEKVKYWVPGMKPSKSERRLRTDIRHQQRNEANAVKRMTRLVHANFTGGGAEIVLTYDDEHMERLETVCAGSEDFEDALYHAGHKELRLWLRRARRACAAEGVEFRYIAVTSDRDGKTGDMVRVHHHVIVNEEAAEIVIGKWGRGITKKKLLSSEPDKMEFVGYLLQQVRRLPDEKKYIPSRNLIVPQPVDRIAHSGAELAVPKNGQLIERAAYKPGKPQYIRYILPEVGQIKKEMKKQKRETSAPAARGGARMRTKDDGGGETT
mgnify:CR=1 FL=1